MKEIPGPKHNQTIVDFMKRFSGGAIYDDETAWCGGFMGFILERNNLPIPANPLGARQYLTIGKRLDKPAVGALAVWWRGERNGYMGHVNLIGGRSARGWLVCVGGNQNNAVTWAEYQHEGEGNRLLGYVWPSIWPAAERFNLPLLNVKGSVLSES